MNGVHLSEESDCCWDDEPDIFAWGATLTSSCPEVTWHPFSDDNAKEHSDVHHLLIKQAVLASSAKDSERNIIHFETFGFDNQPLNIPFISLLRNRKEMCSLDMRFQPCGDKGVKFKLVEGSGPVYLSGEHHLEAEDNCSDGESESFSPLPKKSAVTKTSSIKAKASPKIKATKKSELDVNKKKAAAIKEEVKETEQKVKVKREKKDSVKLTNDSAGVEDMIYGLSIVQKKNTRANENDKKAAAFNSDGFKPEGMVKRKKAVE